MTGGVQIADALMAENFRLQMTSSSHGTRVACIVGLVSVLSPAASPGQVLTTLEFSFSNPGARSIGLAGAFVGLADDATAAFANPAGLVQLARPEISIEGRAWSYSTAYTQGGRAAGQPTGLGIDTVPEPVQADSEAELSGLSYLSYVYPRKRWSVAVFQHRLMNFELRQEIQGLFVHSKNGMEFIRIIGNDREIGDWEVVVADGASTPILLTAFAFIHRCCENR